jgi:anthranilate synthase/aminodeoxychorismate synthase-like glutamine amidotransferase
MILMIDNYDSFTYNLVQYLEEIGTPVHVVRNDVMDSDQLEALAPKALVISPGPGGPKDAGVSLAAIRHFSGRIPVLGVCLGHQSIAEAFGASIIGAQRLMHGKTSTITSDGEGVFAGLNKPFQAMRYHSLAVARNTLPECLKITAESEDGEIMGIRHTSHPTEGIQFHPESIMTTVGKRLLRNFVKMMG